MRARLHNQIEAVIDAACYDTFDEYGGRSLSQVICFEPRHSDLVREAAGRLEGGTDTGVLPERFLVAAARVALARVRTAPATIHRNFYDALGRR